MREQADRGHSRLANDWLPSAAALSPPVERSLRRRLLLAALLGCWFFVVGFCHSRRAAIVGDLAEYVNNPVRLLVGEIPYRDFWLLHPPGEVVFPAALYALGFGMNAVLTASLTVNVLLGGAAFLVARPLVRSDAEAALAAAVVFFSGVPHDYGSFVCLQGYFLCLLVAAAFLIRHLARPGILPLFLAGLAISAGSFFKLYLSGAAGVALFATVFLEARRRACRVSERARLLAALTTGTLVVPLVMTVCFAGVYPDFWYAIAIDSVSHATVLRPGYGHKLLEFRADAVPVLRALRDDPFAWTAGGLLKLSRFVEMTTIHAVPFLAGALAWYGWRKQLVPRGRTGWLLLYFLLWGELTFFRAYLRGGSTTSLIQAATPLFFTLILLARPLVAQARVSKKAGGLLAATGVLAALAGLGQWSAALTIGEALTWREPVYRAVAPYGALATADSAEAAHSRELITAIVENSAESDYVFVTPWNAPPLYALTRRRNPTHYDSLIDLTHRPSREKQRSVCADLVARETRLVVHRPHWRTGSDSFENACPLIDECLRTHFEPFRECGPFSVWRRKPGDCAARAPAPPPRRRGHCALKQNRPRKVLRDQIAVAVHVDLGNPVNRLEIPVERPKHLQVFAGILPVTIVHERFGVVEIDIVIANSPRNRLGDEILHARIDQFAMSELVDHLIQPAPRRTLADSSHRATDILRHFARQQKNLAEVVDERDQKEIRVGDAVPLHGGQRLPDVEHLAGAAQIEIGDVHAVREFLDEIPDVHPPEDRLLVLSLERGHAFCRLPAVLLEDAARFVMKLLPDTLPKGWFGGRSSAGSRSGVRSAGVG
jgi:hypothetical protein